MNSLSNAGFLRYLARNHLKKSSYQFAGHGFKSCTSTMRLPNLKVGVSVSIISVMLLREKGFARRKCWLRMHARTVMVMLPFNQSERK